MSDLLPEWLLWALVSSFELAVLWLQPVSPPPSKFSKRKHPTLETFQLPRYQSAEAEDTPTYTPRSKQKQQQASFQRTRTSIPEGCRSGRRGNVYSGSISAEGLSETDLTWCPPVYTKDVATKNRLRDILKNNILMLHLPLPSQLTVVEALEMVEIEAGQVLVTEGEVGEACYIVESGTMSCSMMEKGHRCDYVRGQTFGELALMYGNTRAATITVLPIQAVTHCLLWKLDRLTFKKIVLSAAQPDIGSFIGFIDEVPIFSNSHAETLAMTEKMKLVTSAHHLEYRPGDVLIERGHKNSERYMFLIQSGTVEVKSEDKVLETVVRLGFFGEKAILTDEIPSASAVACEQCKVYRVPETVVTSFPRNMIDSLRLGAINRFV